MEYSIWLFCDQILKTISAPLVNVDFQKLLTLKNVLNDYGMFSQHVTIGKYPETLIHVE